MWCILMGMECTTDVMGPEPFAHRRADMVLEALSQADAMTLVSQVMAQEDVTPHPSDPGSTPQDITDLVEAVGRHPRALVLLAREVARQGVRATTATVRELMMALHARYPDDREQSLYASVELSLRRLAPEVRAQLQPLAVVQGGASLGVWAHILDVDVKTVRNTANAVIAVGLGKDLGCDHLRLDPALPSYLLEAMDEVQQECWRSRWADGMEELVVFLYTQRFRDAELATHLTRLEMPNLLAWLTWLRDRKTPEKIVELACAVEVLLAPLGRHQALAQVIAVCEKAAQALGAWGHAHFVAESAYVERLRERSDLQAATIAARRLLQLCLDAGEAAYAGAAYDFALAHFILGRVLQDSGNMDAALPLLAKAQQRFRLLAEAGNSSAEHMISVIISDCGHSLTALGRLEEAAAVYMEAITQDEKRKDKRSVAVGKAQFANVRRLQQCYAEALTLYTEALPLFHALDEPRNVASIWHQIGIVHRQKGNLQQAEHAYKESLALEVQYHNLAGEANSLLELGNLYDDIGCLEEAEIFSRQAVAKFVSLCDLLGEGRAHNNLAATLIKLKHYDDARCELHRALECNKPFGHNAEPWKTWSLLHILEQAAGNSQAATDSWQLAVQCYLTYRRAGGESQEPSARLCAQIAHAIRQGDTIEVTHFLAQAAVAADTPSWLKAMLPKLHTILHGYCDPALAADPALDYRDAAELLLLLETLGGR
jgi:tetratricopeptide (TPR) repeat protein